ncbi:MAG: carboxymuconolactone decarboxylase family protein [Rhodobacteraceae bacterium]|nr:carboxymuconolactone decarboxylase family protein [Paracoccaceae bacterium]
MDWKACIAEANRNLARCCHRAPEAAAGFAGMAKAVMAEGAFGVKEKEPACLAIGIFGQCNDCIGVHLRAAIRAGATREEVAETISVTMYMGGGPAFMYGARALEASDQFAA